MYTGDSNVNVVGVEASADVTTSVAFLITLENGTIAVSYTHLTLPTKRIV